MASPYDVLGLDPGADEEAIERAYRQRVKEAHPDHGGSQAEFRAVRTAYEELTARDAALEAGTGPPSSPATDTGASAHRSPSDPDSGPGSRDPSARRGADRATGAAGDDIWEERDDGEGEDPEPAGADVEYLNYEVLDDHGWDLADGDLFEAASAAGLDPSDYGRVQVDADEPLLSGVETCGFAWPYACRGGACANCAVRVVEGELSMPVDHILPAEMTDRGIRLSCVGRPETDELKVVYNVKHLPDLEDLRLPPRPFKQAHGDD